MKNIFILMGFVILMALAVIKIGSNANWPSLFPQEDSEVTSSDSQSFSEWKADWEERIANGVTLSE